MQTRRILIVDDAPEFANLVKDALSTMDIPLQVTIYLSGEEAWLEALKTRFDLVVTDLRLPGISGTELIRRIRARFPRIKIIAVSGLAEAGLNERTRAAGVDAFYPKPVEIPLLLTKIDNLLSDLSHDLVEPADASPKPSITSPVVTMPLKPLPDTKPEVPPPSPTPQSLAATKILHEPPRKEKKDTPDDSTVMRDLEQRLIKLMNDCDAEGVALSTIAGQMLFRSGSAENFKFADTLINGCTSLVNTLKLMEQQPNERTSLSLAAFSSHTADLFITQISKFFIWLIFPSASQPAEAAQVATAVYTSRDSLQFIMNMLSQTPEPALPAAPARQDEPQKGSPVPMHTDELKLTHVEPGKNADHKQVDAFWDADPDSKNGQGILPDTITFDKAASLGLVPPEKNDK
jgi:CheY-like chemotaxis protein